MSSWEAAPQWMNTGARPAAVRTTVSVTAWRSATVILVISPVVPQG